MSTPSTATLQPHQSHYGYSHHQNYQANGSAYRTTSTGVNGNSRLATSYTLQGLPTHAPASITSTEASHSTPSTSNPMSKEDSKPSAGSVSHAATDSSKKKRQRSREPDWNNFYKNGLPKEVIVIDDSPPPRVSNTPEAITAGTVHPSETARPIATTTTRHAAKKRKRDDIYDAVYQKHASHSNTHTPYNNDSASGSTISTDRTTSAIHTTAATSLGSQYSNGGANGVYQTDVQPGSKRKRVTTRGQAANEAKRRDIEVNGDAFSNYKAPPRPPIKCDEVKVAVIPDVRVPTDLMMTVVLMTLADFIYERPQGRRRRRALYCGARHTNYRSMYVMYALAGN
jgi:dual-specificity kinase